MEPHNVNDESDQVEGVKNVVVNNILDLISGERYSINIGGNAQLTLDGDVIDDILEEESDYVYSGDQILNHVEKGIFEMGLDTRIQQVFFI